MTIIPQITRCLICGQPIISAYGDYLTHALNIKNHVCANVVNQLMDKSKQDYRTCEKALLCNEKDIDKALKWISYSQN